MKTNLKYIYGPVESWRMGKSLGVDPLSSKEKICNLNCVYCQLGKTEHLSTERKIYVPTKDIIKELKGIDVPDLDYITFCGRGEPTLAKNLGDMIKNVRWIRQEEIAVITNSTLMYLPEVRRDLALADLVIAKLDACDERTFLGISDIIDGVSYENVVRGLKKFREEYKGRYVLQIMFVEENKKFAAQIAKIARWINPDEIQINTPLRPSAAVPINEQGMKEIKEHFRGLPAVSVYEHDRKETIPLDVNSTIARHGNYRKIVKIKDEVNCD